MLYRSLLPVALFVTIASSSALAQTTAPTPKAADEEVVKITTTLVQVDVTVTDQNNRVVRDLSPSDFEIYQNGKKQPISNFSFVSSVSPDEAAGPQANTSPRLAANVLPPPQIRAANVRRTIALVVDDLNLSWQSTVQVQIALRRFVDTEMQPGDLVAIIRTGAGVGALQQFTNDKRQLYAAIDRVKYSIGTGHIGAFQPLEGKSDVPSGLNNTDALDRSVDQFKASVMATGTLGALNFVIRGMSDLPGRKSIMLFSDGFSLYPKDQNGDRESTRVYEALKNLVDRANRASVVIYTFDPRGLVVTGLTAADDVRGLSLQEIRQTEDDRVSQMIDTQEGLLYLAKETGGRAIRNNNDIPGSLKKIVDDQSYYLIGYVPDEETFDPSSSKFNSLTIRVNRPGLLVRYRSGFFNTPDKKQSAAAEIKPSQKLEYALTSPFGLNEVELHFNGLFQHTEQDGSYIRSLLHIRGRDLTAVDVAGGKKIAFDVLAVTMGDNGEAVEHLSKSFTVTLKPDVYERLRQTGFVYDFMFPIKKPGAYQMRVAIRDRTSQKVGSANQFIEVPDLTKHRLTLSGIAVEGSTRGTSPASETSSALSDTALRQFKRGSMLRFGFAIYNADGSPPKLSSKVRLFKDGHPVFEGKDIPIEPIKSTDPKIVPFDSALNLGTNLTAGDYVLEVVVTDQNRTGKDATVAEYVQFEITD